MEKQLIEFILLSLCIFLSPLIYYKLISWHYIFSIIPWVLIWIGHCELIANCHNEKHKAKLSYCVAQVLLVGKYWRRTWRSRGQSLTQQLAQCPLLGLLSVSHIEFKQWDSKQVVGENRILHFQWVSHQQINY